MANYTMELREYIEMWSQDETLSTREQIERGRTKLFDFDYPIFDPDYKKVFETHFIRKFYMREIGSETEGLFKFNLETWLLINMPYFNNLFKSELITFDPLTNTKIDTTKNKTNDKTSSSTNTTDGTSNSTSDGTSNKTKHDETTGSETNSDFVRHLEADTPDNRLNLTTEDGKGVIEYASKIVEDINSASHDQSKTSDTTDNVTNHATSSDESNVTSTGSGTINEIEDYLESKTGKIGSQTFASMLNEYRQSFLRIENQIFREIEKEGLFMLVY